MKDGVEIAAEVGAGMDRGLSYSSLLRKQGGNSGVAGKGEVQIVFCWWWWLCSSYRDMHTLYYLHHTQLGLHSSTHIHTDSLHLYIWVATHQNAQEKERQKAVCWRTLTNFGKRYEEVGGQLIDEMKKKKNKKRRKGTSVNN